MKVTDQGDIIRVSHGRVPFLVVSSAFYNQSGLAVVCPIVSDALPDAMHIKIDTEQISGIVLCEQIAVVSIADRACSIKSHLFGSSLLEIIFRVQSIFDYVPHT